MDNNKLINNAYQEVVGIGVFDIKKGNEPIDGNDYLGNIPDKMHTYVGLTHYGCCFAFSGFMMHILDNYGIENYMVVTKEDSGLRASVLYDLDGELLIANPVEDIEYFTKNNIDFTKRYRHYVPKTNIFKTENEVHNNAEIPLKEFYEKYGDIEVLPRFKDNYTTTLNEAMNDRLSIANNEYIIKDISELRELLKTK